MQRENYDDVYENRDHSLTQTSINIRRHIQSKRQFIKTLRPYNSYLYGMIWYSMVWLRAEPLYQRAALAVKVDYFATPLLLFIKII